MNIIRDHNYYDRDGCPPSTLEEEARRNSRVKSTKGEKDEVSDEMFIYHDGKGEEERPTRFPLKNELDVILRKVRSVLNKISALNYNKLQHRWVNLIPNEPDHLREILQLLISKALDDPMYMQIYARLVSDVIRMNPAITGFLKTTISNLLHHMLQKMTTDIEVAKSGPSSALQDATRRKKVMLYRFIAELFLENVCTTGFVVSRVEDLIDQGKSNPREPDEPLECLCIFLMFAGSKLEEFKGAWLDDVFVQLHLSESSRLRVTSRRMQFMLVDLIEMRSNGWASQNKWWVSPVPLNGNSTVDVELDHLKAVRSTKRKRSKKNSSSTRHREKTLRVILNQVVPSNMERMVVEFGRILQKRNTKIDNAVQTITRHILENPDPMYTRVQAVLLSKLCSGNPQLKMKLVDNLFSCIKENPNSLPATRFCTELYIRGIISLGEIISILQKNPATGLECACVFFHRAQFKLFRDWKKIRRFEKLKIEHLLESMAKRAQDVESLRLRCMVLDVLDWHQNNWESNGIRGRLLWNSVGVSHRALMFSIENAVSVFNENEEDGLEFMQENLGTNRGEIEKFVETMCIWAIWRGDLNVLGVCGKYIKAINGIRLLTATRLHQILGSLIQNVITMKNKRDAWGHLGVLMHGLYEPEQ